MGVSVSAPSLMALRATAAHLGVLPPARGSTMGSTEAGTGGARPRPVARASATVPAMGLPPLQPLSDALPWGRLVVSPQPLAELRTSSGGASFSTAPGFTSPPPLHHRNGWVGQSVAIRYLHYHYHYHYSYCHYHLPVLATIEHLCALQRLCAAAAAERRPDDLVETLLAQIQAETAAAVDCRPVKWGWK